MSIHRRFDCNPSSYQLLTLDSTNLPLPRAILQSMQHVPPKARYPVDNIAIFIVEKSISTITNRPIKFATLRRTDGRTHNKCVVWKVIALAQYIRPLSCWEALDEDTFKRSRLYHILYIKLHLHTAYIHSCIRSVRNLQANHTRPNLVFPRSPRVSQGFPIFNFLQIPRSLKVRSYPQFRSSVSPLFTLRYREKPRQLSDFFPVAPLIESLASGSLDPKTSWSYEDLCVEQFLAGVTSIEGLQASNSASFLEFLFFE